MCFKISLQIEVKSISVFLSQTFYYYSKEKKFKEKEF